MKLVSYILRLFLPMFIISLLVFSFILELVDLMMNIWKYIYNSVPLKQIAIILLNYLPKTISWAIPLSMLFATCFILSSLYAKNELTAIFACGVSLLRFTFPIIIFSCMLTIFLFVFQNRVVVPCNFLYESLKEQAIGQKKNLNNNNIVIISDRGKIVYKADFYDDELERLYRLYIVIRNENHELLYILNAEYATWNKENSCWKLYNGVQYDYKDKNLVSSTVSMQIEGRLTEPPETFRNNTISVETVSVKQAKSYINHLKRTGLPYNEALSQYYNKFSFPFVIIIMAFLSIGISGKSTRNVFIISLTLSLMAAVGFYVTQMVTMLMAKFGMISPILGAWFPVFLFFALTALLLKKTRT